MLCPQRSYHEMQLYRSEGRHKDAQYEDTFKLAWTSKGTNRNTMARHRAIAWRESAI